MKVLWVATKAPWPSVDGGRLLLWNTLQGLEAAGHDVRLVATVDAETFDLEAVAAALAPVCTPDLVPVRRRPVGDLLRATVGRQPLTIARHRRPSVARRVASALASEPFDVVQAEQIQAFAQIPERCPVPRVVRAQNVESALWQATASSPSLRARWLRGPLLRLEASRLARWEGDVVRRADATVALTAEDAWSLRALAGGVEVAVAPAPVDSELPAAERTLPGAPAVVLLGSAGWLPNLDGARWFVDAVWPRLRRAAPGAQLHVFGLEGLGRSGTAAGVSDHPAPADSRQAFAPGSILAVPLVVASGVRMKILEAWARGVPVVATPAAAGGLIADHGRELLIAGSAAAMAAAIASLAADPDRVASLVAAARRRLAESYAPSAAVAALESVWSGLVGASPSADGVMNSA